MDLNIGLGIGANQRNSLPSWYQQEDFADIDWGDNFGAFQFQNNLYAKDGSSVLLPDIMTSTHSTDILALNDSGTYDTFTPNEIVRNSLGLHEVPASRTNYIIADLLSLVRGSNTTLTHMPDEVGMSGLTGNVYRLQLPTLSSTFLRLSTALNGERVLSVAAKAYNNSPSTDFSMQIGDGGSIGANIAIFTTTNEWQKFSHTVPTPPNSATYINNTGDTFAADILIELPQLEEGSFSTSPILPSSTPVTRPGARHVMTGLTLDTGITFGCIFDIQDPGTNSIRIFEFSDGTVNNRFLLYYSNGNIQLQLRTDTVYTALFTLDNWKMGVDGFIFSLGNDYLKIKRINGDLYTDYTIDFPNLNMFSPFSRGTTNSQNTNGVMKEVYWQSGTTVSDDSFNKFETMIQNRYDKHINNLITNGNFDENLDGWNNTSGNYTWENGVVFRSTTGSLDSFTQDIPTEIGKTYRFSAEITNLTLSPGIEINGNNTQTMVNGHNSITFVATTTTTSIGFVSMNAEFKADRVRFVEID